MGQWALVTYVGAGLAGTLVFLALVAQELRLLGRALELRKAFEVDRQMRQQAVEAQVVDGGQAHL